MATSATLGSQTLGQPVPPSDVHAVSVSLPTWSNIVDYIADKEDIAELVVTGYPRFSPRIHPIIRKDICKQKFGVDDEQCMMFRSKNIADQCEAFLRYQAALAGTPVSIRHVQYIIQPEDSVPQARLSQCAELHIAFIPDNLTPFGDDFWSHTGLGISSRFAEHFLSLLPGRDKENTEPLGVVSQASGTITRPSDIFRKDQNTYIEEGYGGDSSLCAGAVAKQVLRRRIAGAITTGKVQDGPQGPCNGAQEIEIVPDSKGIQVVSEDDVFLFPCGMAAIWNAYNLCLRARPQAKSVVFGMPYMDTLKLLQKWGPGVHFYGHGHDSDMDALENLLAEESSREPTKPPILALFTELPTNPLLRSPDLPRLRVLADTYDFLIVIDETIGNFVNVEVLPYADIVITSMTKVFSGQANVMGGSLVLNPKGQHYATLMSHMGDYEDAYFDGDAVVMERNSRDMVRRVRIVNENAEAVCAFLRSHSAAEGAPSAVIKDVFYPKYTTPTKYLQCKRPEGGYGGLCSVTFTSLAASKAFFDALPCFKGPTIGTNFTLALPYTIFVFPKEIQWAEQYGVDEGLVRISVGMEDKDVLLRAFDAALKAAEAAQ